MTLIAFHTEADRADIITDTWWYTRTAREVETTSKVHLLPHLDAAFMTQGSTNFQKAWSAYAIDIGHKASSFDEFHRRTEETLPAVWKELNGYDGYSPPPSTLFNVGWSRRDRRFNAYAYASGTGWRTMPVDGLYVMPSPLDVRPFDIELDRLEQHFMANFGDATPVTRLRQLDRPTPPDSVEEWVALAEKVRRHRSLAHLYSGFKTYIGGHVIHTRLEEGASTQRRIHAFNDTGEEFRQMMAYSLHREGQLGPCQCDSGRRLIDCCLPQIFAEPCPCASGETFENCCLVDEHTTSAPAGNGQ